MLDELKNLAARQLGKALASDTTMKVLSNQQVQSAMMRAINLRAEARDLVESRIHGVATALDLVTHEDVAALRRTLRDLEDTIEELRDELSETQAQHQESAVVDVAPVVNAGTKTTVNKTKTKTKTAKTRATKTSKTKAPRASKASRAKAPAKKAAGGKGKRS